MSARIFTSVTLCGVLLCACLSQRPHLPAPLEQSSRNEAYRLVLTDATTHLQARIRVFEEVRGWWGPVNEMAPYVPASVYRKGVIVGQILGADSIAKTLGMLPRSHGAPSPMWGSAPVVVRVFEQLPAKSSDSLQLVVVLDIGTPAEITWYSVVRKDQGWLARRIGHFEF